MWYKCQGSNNPLVLYWKEKKKNIVIKGQKGLFHMIFHPSFLPNGDPHSP